MTTLPVIRSTQSLSDVIYQSPSLVVYRDNGRLVAEFKKGDKV